MINFFSFLLVLTLAWTTSYYAEKRGRNALLWFILGLFGIIPLIVLFILKPVNKKKVPANKTVIDVEPVVETLPQQGWFYLDTENKQYGPVSLIKLKQLQKDEVISQNSFVWNEFMKDWTELKDALPQ